MAQPPRQDLERVFRAHYPRVVGVAQRVVGDRHAAEDVAQEAFLAFSRSAVPESAARGWLCAAAAHLALNAIRSEHRRAGREALHDADPTSSTAAGTAPDAAESAVVSLDRARVRAGLAALPRPQAVALVLRHSGTGYAEIADALGIAASGVGTTIRRAEAALREELSRDEPRG